MPYVHPDHLLEHALRLLVQPLEFPNGAPTQAAVGTVPRPLLPVAHRADLTHVVGVITPPDVLRVRHWARGLKAKGGRRKGGRTEYA